MQEALPTGPHNYWCFVKGLLCPEACSGLWGPEEKETQSFCCGVPRPAGRPVGASGLGREVLREGRSVPPPPPTRAWSSGCRRGLGEVIG